MNDKIFVMLPAYIDPDLALTLTEMYTKADKPENLTIAIGMSYLDEKDIPKQTVVPNKQLKVLYWDAHNRPGTMRVRSLLNDFYTDEQYYFSIDSHMLFAEGWDTEIKKELNELSKMVENDKVILINHRRSCKFTIVKDKTYPLFTLKGSSFSISPTVEGRFARADFLFAGLFFTYGKFATDVGWIKDVNMILEEPYMSYRAYVNGWDLYHNLTDEVYTHSPLNYYDNVKKVGWIGWNPDPERYFVEVLFALLFNEGYFAVENPVRTNQEWWNKIGLLKESEEYKKLFVKLKVLDNIEELAKKFELR